MPGKRHGGAICGSPQFKTAVKREFLFSLFLPRVISPDHGLFPTPLGRGQVGIQITIWHRVIQESGLSTSLSFFFSLLNKAGVLEARRDFGV